MYYIWKKHVQKPKRKLNDFDDDMEFISLKRQESCLTSKINSMINVKPMNILCLSYN